MLHLASTFFKKLADSRLKATGAERVAAIIRQYIAGTIGEALNRYDGEFSWRLQQTTHVVDQCGRSHVSLSVNSWPYGVHVTVESCHRRHMED